MIRCASVAALGAAIALVGAASASTAQVVERSGHSFHVRVCGGPTVAGVARCHAHIVTDSVGRPLSMIARTRGARPAARAAVSGGPYWASQIRAAYGISGNGAPTTLVAIVDAYGYTNAASDVATYRSAQWIARVGFVRVFYFSNDAVSEHRQRDGRGQPAEVERGLGRRAGAGPRHGQRHVPELQHRSGAGQFGELQRPRHGGKHRG